MLIRAFGLVLSWSGFRHTARFNAVYCLLSQAGKFKTSITRLPYNKLLTNPASSSRTGEYWHLVVFVRALGTATTSGQYSLVRPSHSVCKRLLLSLCWALGHVLRDKIETLAG